MTIPKNILVRTNKIKALEEKIDTSFFESEIVAKQDELLKKYELPVNVTSVKQLVGKKIVLVKLPKNYIGNDSLSDVEIIFHDGTKLEVIGSDSYGPEIYRGFHEWELPKQLLDEYIIFLRSLVPRSKKEAHHRELEKARQQLEKAKEKVKKLEKK